MENDYTLIDNTEAKRFEFQLDEAIAYIEYTVKQDNIYLTHTEVPKELGGRGIGSSLVKMTLEEIKSRKLRVIPACPFIKAYIKRHPKWQGQIIEKQ